MSGARGFYYGDCRSQDRRNREYGPDTANETLTSGNYDSTIGKFYNRITKQPAGAQFEWIFLKSQIFKYYELTWIGRSDVDPGNEPGVSIFLCPTALSTATGRGFAEIGGGAYILKGSFDYYGISGVVIPYVKNSWYNYKWRDDGKYWRIKKWLYGTAEPGWLYALTEKNKAAVIEQGDFSRAGYIGFGSFIAGGAARSHDFADIRIKPVPRLGGP